MHEPFMSASSTHLRPVTRACRPRQWVSCSLGFLLQSPSRVLSVSLPLDRKCLYLWISQTGRRW